MTHLALLLAVSFPTAPLGADDPNAPATELQGAWREPTKSGEKAGDAFTVTFAGDKITINCDGQVLQGKYTIDHNPKVPKITVAIATVNGRVAAEECVYRGRFCLESGHLHLQIEPYAAREEPSDQSDHHARLKELLADPGSGNDPDRIRELIAEVHTQVEAIRSRPPPYLGLAPVSRKLEKVKK
jgi:hypothetical protein